MMKHTTEHFRPAREREAIRRGAADEQVKAMRETAGRIGLTRHLIIGVREIAREGNGTSATEDLLVALELLGIAVPSVEEWPVREDKWTDVLKPYLAHSGVARPA